MPIDNAAIIKSISERRKRLDAASAALKDHFVGLDQVIDNVIRKIEAWYCLPELMTRPTTLCLWGLTGTGKTDLVRRLVALLDMSDSFLEVQMTNQGSSKDTCFTTIESLMNMSSLTVAGGGILLLDEIQRFRSKDEKGSAIHDYRFQDVWALLSDGNFGGKSSLKNCLNEMLLEAAYDEDYALAAAEANDKVKTTDAPTADDQKQDIINNRRRFRQSFWKASRMKDRLNLSEDLREIMSWDNQKSIDIIRNKMSDKSIFDAKIHNRLLVVISGNLDEAFSMANATDEADIDADIFHEHSLKVNMIGIKNALSTRFTPEQVGRFGNNHVIYPSLSRADYREIIRRKVAVLATDVHRHSGVKFSFSKKLLDAIYRNGVFPAQGTRPLFSTISGMLESMIPFFLLEALRAGQGEVSIDYHGSHMVATVGGREVCVHNEGEIDRIRSEINHDKRRCVSVHEAGHGVAYAVVTGIAPLQMNANSVSDDKNGFTIPHGYALSTSYFMDAMLVLMAGRAAEEIVFGSSHVQAGNAGDVRRATAIAATMVRQTQMGGRFSAITVEVDTDAPAKNTDHNSTNAAIEAIVRERHEAAVQVLLAHKALLVEVSDVLCSLGKDQSLSAAAFRKIALRHGLKVCVQKNGFVRYAPYEDMIDAVRLGCHPGATATPSTVVPRSTSCGKLVADHLTPIPERNSVLGSILHTD